MKRKGLAEYDFWALPEGLKLKESYRRANRTALPPGCGVASFSEEQLQSLRDLCERIIDELPSMVPWGDGWVDNKKRGYAMFPGQSSWTSVQQITDAGIVLHDVDSSYSIDRNVRRAAIRKHQLTVSKSFISMCPTEEEVAALRTVVELAREIVEQARDTLQPYEADCVSMENLVAIQPNVHNGDDYLPLHLDNPRHDGFGVVIVTVALWGTADIVLADDGDPIPEVEPEPKSGLVLDPESDPGPGAAAALEAKRPAVCISSSNGESPVTAEALHAEPPVPEGDGSQSWAFTLKPGELYVLSGHARNKCAHGVVVLQEGEATGSENYTGQRGRGRRTQQAQTAQATETGKVETEDKKRAINRRWGRVSLNVRFGLHTKEQAWQDIDRHWA